MERSEAKEGVRVRYTPVTSGAIAEVINHCGTLEKLNSLAELGCYVKFDSGPKYYCSYKNLTVLEPPAQHIPSPIVTETRRYIKAGTHGFVGIEEVSYGNVCVRLGPQWFDAQELRGIIKTLTEVAEVLEENAP